MRAFAKLHVLSGSAVLRTGRASQPSVPRAMQCGCILSGSLTAASDDWPTHVPVSCLQREASPTLQGQRRAATPADLAGGGERAASAGSKDATGIQPEEFGQPPAGASSEKGKQAGSSTGMTGSSRAGSTPQEQVAAAKVRGQNSEGGTGTDCIDAKGWTAAGVN